MVQGRPIGVLLGVALLAALGLSVSCAKERPTAPHAGSWRVYVTAFGWTPQVYVFDAEADTLLGTVSQPSGWGDYQIICDPVAPSYATVRSANARFYRSAENSPYREESLLTVGLAYDSQRELLIGSVGGHGVVGGSRFRVYGHDDLSVLFSDTFGIGEVIRLNHQRGLAFGVTVYQVIPGGPDYRTELCSYDYVNRRFNRCWNILPDSTGRGYDIPRFALHPDGRRVYLTGGKTHLFGYDLIEDRVFFDVPVYGPFGEPAVSLDGREVWYPEGGIDLWTDPGTITIYDASNGAVKHTIELNGYRVKPNRPVRPTYIRFVPPGDKAYVVCRGEQGPVLIIDTRSREVIKSFYLRSGLDPELFISRMDIGPAP